MTVSASQDDDASNDTATLTHTASGGDYASVTSNLTAMTTTYDDTPGLVLSTATLAVSEGGDASYTVKPATQPTASVTVADLRPLRDGPDAGPPAPDAHDLGLEHDADGDGLCGQGRRRGG